MPSLTLSKVTPFLMFTGRAEEALQFYAGLLDDAAIEVIERYGPEGPGAEGSVMHARLRIGDQALMAFDSPPVHEFDFTPSLSLFVSLRERGGDRSAVRGPERGWVRHDAALHGVRVLGEARLPERPLRRVVAAVAAARLRWRSLRWRASGACWSAVSSLTGRLAGGYPA